ncbi:H-hydrate dehydratase [Collybia nuda]|uniref:ATP-dependent (S)-NAD(P)H-hydrate dehydratase n=1 Tax=Collybia nuda TaxID=64659 RepID=A0A9P5Y835_9AGAR|nr:H-hydrate dehydratase [Collybia nuda]
MPVPDSILDQLKLLIPPLDGTLHKGQSGRVGVLGGALDYTGAPYFAIISALRFGADGAHVICSPTAGGVIKSYSPDLVVHPILREDSTLEQVKPELKSLLSRLHSLVIGPGLGREPYMQSFAKLALTLARAQGMFVVLDADALWMVGQDLVLIKGYRRAVLTPNVVEFKRLCDQIGMNPEIPAGERASLISKELGGVTVLQKGARDIISIDTTGDTADLSTSHLQGASEEREKTKETIEIDVQGGMKRCGGQGDVLSGCVGAVLAWGKCYEEGAYGDGTVPPSRVPLLAAVGGSIVTRTTNKRAFSKQGRGTVTADMIPEISLAFEEMLGSGQN